MSLGQTVNALFGDTAVLVAVLALAMFPAAALAGVRAHRRPYSIRPTAYTPALDDDLVEELPESRLILRFESALIFVLAGYLFFDRAFAWIHVPGLPLFVGEMMIAFGLVAMASTPFRLGPLIRNSGALKALLAYMAWGALLLLPRLPVYGQDAIRDAALWYYGIVAVFVVFLIQLRPARVERWVLLFAKAIPYFLLWFPIAIVADALYDEVVPVVPDSLIPITSHRTGNMAVMAAAGLGFLWLVDRDNEIFTERQRVGLTSLATIVILFAGMKNRGGFLAAAIGLTVAALFLRRKRTEISMVMIGVVVLLLTVGLLGNVKIDLFSDGREVSVDQMLNNLTSIIDQDAGGSRQTSTTTWRLQIWSNVLRDVAREYPLAGFGPGPDLGERYGITGVEAQPLRNPHNSHVGVLARSGFVGTGLWAIMFAVWTVELLLARSRMLVRGHTVEAGLVAWMIFSLIAILVNAIFDPTLEGPQVAWWLWAIFGFGVSLVALDRTGRLPAISLAAARQRSTSPPRLRVRERG